MSNKDPKSCVDSKYLTECSAVCNSQHLHDCDAVHTCEDLCMSDACERSHDAEQMFSAYCASNAWFAYGVHTSSALVHSNGVIHGYGLENCQGVALSAFMRNCEGAARCLFCYGLEGGRLYVFNQRVDEKRFDKLWKDFVKDTWGEKEYWRPDFFGNLQKAREDHNGAYNDPKLFTQIRKRSYAEMPEELVAKIKALPEFNAEIWKAITGRKD